jgi:hypothetical protein
MLQTSVSAALAETSQTLQPASDPRSPAQIAFDRRMGGDVRLTAG